MNLYYITTRFFISFCLLFGFALGQAQLSLSKTLDDPGITPVYEFDWATYIEGSRSATWAHRTEGVTRILFTFDRNSPRFFIEDQEFVVIEGLSEDDISTAPYRMFYTSDDNTTPVDFSPTLGDTIPLANNLKLFFTIDSFVAYQTEQAGGDEGVITPYFGNELDLLGTIAGGANPPGSVFGTFGTPIEFGSDELAILGDSDGHTLKLVQTATTEQKTFLIPANTDAQGIADALRAAAATFTIYVEEDIAEDGTLSVYADEAFTIEDVGAVAQTDSRCYDTANAGTVGQEGWTGCEDMYIVTDLAEFQTATNNNYTITLNEVAYTFGDSANNVFTGQVTSMSELFFNQPTFNEDIGYWDTSNVTDMFLLFWDATAFNQDIGSWNTTNVTNMEGMFRKASAFNQDLSGWNVELITSKPEDFDAGATSWTNQSWRPLWGTNSVKSFSSLGLRAYPNPATSHLFIDNPLGITLSYTVYDLTGKQHAIYHKTGQQHSINVSSLAKGVYLLAGKHGDQTGVFRFVKK